MNFFESNEVRDLKRIWYGAILITWATFSSILFCVWKEMYDFCELLIKSILLGFAGSVSGILVALIIFAGVREIAFKKFPYSYNKIGIAAIWSMSSVLLFGFNDIAVRIMFGLIWIIITLKYIIWGE